MHTGGLMARNVDYNCSMNVPLFGFIDENIVILNTFTISKKFDNIFIVISTIATYHYDVRCYFYTLIIFHTFHLKRKTNLNKVFGRV